MINKRDKWLCRVSKTTIPAGWKRNGKEEIQYVCRACVLLTCGSCLFGIISGVVLYSQLGDAQMRPADDSELVKMRSLGREDTMQLSAPALRSHSQHSLESRCHTRVGLVNQRELSAEESPASGSPPRTEYLFFRMDGPGVDLEVRSALA